MVVAIFEEQWLHIKIHEKFGAKIPSIRFTPALLHWIWESPYRFFPNYGYLTNEHPYLKIPIWRRLLLLLSPGFYLGHLRGVLRWCCHLLVKRVTNIYPQNYFCGASYIQFSSVLLCLLVNIHWAYLHARRCDNYSGDRPASIYFFFGFYHLQFSLFNLMPLFSWEQTHSLSPSPPSFPFSVFASFL